MEAVPEDRKCQYTFLGKSGLRVSNIALGTLTFGEHKEGGASVPDQLNESDAHKVIQRYVEWGGNFIDTANYYGKGNSERIVGSWLSSQERDRFVIATKVGINIDPTNPNSGGTGRRNITQNIEDSLRRLQTNHVDLYQFHIWDDGTPLEETLRTMNDLVRCGKLRYLGASNVTGWQMQKIVDMCHYMGLNPVISLQQQYNLACRDSELEPFQVCKTNGIGVLAWSPLKGGVLLGGNKRGERPKKGRMAFTSENEARANEAFPSWAKIQEDQKIWDILDKLETMAKDRGKSVVQVALRWLLQKPLVSSIVTGVNNISQLDENMGSANGWSLTEEEMAELDGVSGPPVPDYPYKMIWTVNAGRTNPWNPHPNV